MRHYCPLCRTFPRPVEKWEGRRGHRQACVYGRDEVKMYKRCPECDGVLLEWWEPEAIETETKKETETCGMRTLLAGTIRRFLRLI